MKIKSPAYELYKITKNDKIRPTFFYIDFESGLIREVYIVEEKTTQFRIEDNSCFVNFVEPEELFLSVNEAIKALGKDEVRVAYINGKIDVIKRSDNKKPFKFPPKYEAKLEHKKELEYVILENIKVHIDDFQERSISDELLNHLKMNSYAREKLPGKLDNQALINKIEMYMGQISHKPEICSTYEESLLYLLLPELLERFKEEVE